MLLTFDLQKGFQRIENFIIVVTAIAATINVTSIEFKMTIRLETKYLMKRHCKAMVCLSYLVMVAN